MVSNIGVWPFNPASPVGNVRVLVGDTDPTQINPPDGISGTYRYYSDAEIEAFLSMYGYDPRRAAVRMLRSIAGSQALILKKFSTDDLIVDGAAIAEALRKLASDIENDLIAEVSAIDIFEISYPGPRCTCPPELSEWKTCYCGVA